MTLGPSKPGDRSSNLVVTQFLGRSKAGDLRDVKLAATVRGVDSQEADLLPALAVGELKWEPKKLTQSVKVNMDQRLVCDVVLTGTGADWQGRSRGILLLLAGHQRREVRSAGRGRCHNL